MPQCTTTYHNYEKHFNNKVILMAKSESEFILYRIKKFKYIKLLDSLKFRHKVREFLHYVCDQDCYIIFIYFRVISFHTMKKMRMYWS
jgi:hypothetical protein